MLMHLSSLSYLATINQCPSLCLTEAPPSSRLAASNQPSSQVYLFFFKIKLWAGPHHFCSFPSTLAPTIGDLGIMDDEGWSCMTSLLRGESPPYPPVRPSVRLVGAAHCMTQHSTTYTLGLNKHEGEGTCMQKMGGHAKDERACGRWADMQDGLCQQLTQSVL